MLCSVGKETFGFSEGHSPRQKGLCSMVTSCQ